MRACLWLLFRRKTRQIRAVTPMPLANTDPPRTATPDEDAKADVEGHAYAWYDPDSADFDRADRWVPADLTEDDEAAALDDR